MFSPTHSTPEWELLGQQHLVSGEWVELFPVKALAVALGREVRTVRKWEEAGALPAAPLRLPPKGNQLAGPRLYRWSHIAGLVTICRELGLAGPYERGKRRPSPYECGLYDRAAQLYVNIRKLHEERV